MMPCPWVPGFVAYMNQHPGLDIGLHLTLTSEWNNYRWGPVLGAEAPTLTDNQGKFYKSVQEVVQHADPAEVAKEIDAQLKLARSMGIAPTHLDSHMGTLFARPEFLASYIQLGIDNGIPVMFPGGHDTEIIKSNPLAKSMSGQLKKIGLQLWNAGLPVLDDLYDASYGWPVPDSARSSDKSLQHYRTYRYIETLKEIKPGITMVIMHCTDPSPTFKYISDSGYTRKGDLLAMLDPSLKKYIDENGIILTTWRELLERRKNIK
jgi:YdjC-like protein